MEHKGLNQLLCAATVNGRFRNILLRDPVQALAVGYQNGQASRLLIRFYNNGPAIPVEVMPHILEPFYTTKKQGQGTGLGLTICERIVQAHGGRIWAENDA